MKKSNLFILVLPLLFISSCGNESSTSLGGGVLITTSEYNPESDSNFPHTSESITTSEEEKLSSIFVGEFVGMDQIQSAKTNLNVNSDGHVNFDISDYDFHLEFNFVEEDKEKSIAYFKSSNDDTLKMEKGASYMFVTVNDANYITNDYLLFDDAQFERI